MFPNYKLPDYLVDNNTTSIPNHTMYSHLICVLFRLIVGLCAYNNYNTGIIILICILFILISGSRFINYKQNWKNYMRPLIVYSTSAILLHKKHNQEAGILIMMDALLSQQSRFEASLLSFNK